jgi:hypothetical protein
MDKQHLLNHLKANCRGRDQAWPVRMLAGFLHADDREIREALRQLNLEGQPVVTLTSKPYGAYYATEQGQIDAYWLSLNSRVLTLLDRMRAVNRMRIDKKQGEMF